MKKFIYLLSLVTVFVLGSCSDDLPKASWDICQVGSFTATAQNEGALLEWTPMEGANPTGYLVTWTPESSEYTGGTVQVDGHVNSYTVEGLVNKVTYTFTIQAIYGDKRSGSFIAKARPVSDTEPYKVWGADMPNSGMVKTSNAIFSLDGSTIYLPSAGATGDITAFDAMTGTIKWTASIPKTTYGGGVAVGADGTLYQGARDANLYAINGDGSQKWVYATGASGKNLDCFPAVTADGQTVYVLDGDNVLHSINTSTGVKNWTVKLTGTKNKAGAVAIGKNGNIYVGTRTNIYAFAADGTQLWQVAGAVTEIGSFAMDGETLYAAQIGGAGLLALNIADGSTKWSFEANGDAYAPIVDKSGNIYFVDKGGKSLYAVDKTGQQKWKFAVESAPTYCFPVLDDKGNIYFGNSTGRIYAVDSSNGEELWHMDSEGTDNNAKIMSGMTIGENQMLYVSYIGGNVAAIKIFAGPEKSTWSCRGGNIHGTNQY